jgi:hypothetical protein
MMSRRDLIASGGVFSQLRLAEAAPAQRGDRASEEGLLREIRDAVNGLRRPVDWSDIAKIRELQRAFAKVNHKFPDFIEIGIQVWERLHTWHIENRLEMKLSRSPEGRLQMEFMMTQLVLRTDVPDNYISVPYER